MNTRNHTTDKNPTTETPKKRTSRQAYNELIYRVDTSRGAPKGRMDKNTHVTVKNKKCVYGQLFDRAVYLSLGYDKGGVYWGMGPQLRVTYSLCLSYVKFYRIEIKKYSR